MKKSTILAAVIIAITAFSSCSSSNGDRSKSGKSDTVGTSTTSNSQLRDSTTSAMDTVKH